MRALLIKGDFTDAEFAEVVALIRRIDAARPDAFFQVLVNNPGDTIEESLRRLRAALPDQADRMTEWFKFKRRHEL